MDITITEKGSRYLDSIGKKDFKDLSGDKWVDWVILAGLNTGKYGSVEELVEEKSDTEVWDVSEEDKKSSLRRLFEVRYIEEV